MKFVFLMDPLETINPLKDTSYIFILGALERGHQVFYLNKQGISYQEGEVFLTVNSLQNTVSSSSDLFEVGQSMRIKAREFDSLFIRTDPPFDEEYLHHTWLLDLAKDDLLIVNSPAGIRQVNEKIWCLRFQELIPQTLVTRSIGEYGSFLSKYSKVVVKPTNGFGGRGIFIVENGKDNNNVIFETISQNGAKDVIVQKYLPESHNGDKRILLLEGDYFGSVLRVHSKSDHRNNFFSGGKPQITTLTEQEKVIIETLAPELRKIGLNFVGLDVIGDKLIEVNVTSPTCVQEINHLESKKLELEFVDWVENKVQKNYG